MSRYRPLVLISLVLFGTWRPAQADPEKARAHFKRGMAEFVLEHWNESIVAFEAGFKEEAQPSFVYNIARAHAKAGRPEQAVIFYRKYLDLAPKTADRVDIEHEIGRLQTKTSPKESPVEAEAKRRFLAGQRLLAEARYQEAIGELEKSYELSSYPAIIYWIGLAYDQLGRVDVALQAYHRYLEEDPKSERRTGVEGRIRTLERLTAPTPAPPRPIPLVTAPVSPVATDRVARSPRKKWPIAVGVVVGLLAAGAAATVAGVLATRSEPTILPVENAR